MSTEETATEACLQRFVRAVALFIAKRHPRNQLHGRQEYPQLWHCWPQWTKSVKWIHRIKTWLCGKLTGHEWSKTEWGYGGGKFADRWCRWCDYFAQIPIDESPPPNRELEELSRKVKNGDPL